MRSLLLLSFTALALAGCRRADPPVDPPPGAPSTPVAPSRTVEPSVPGAPAEEAAGAPGPKATDARPSEQTSSAAAVAPAAPSRDLASELRAAIGSPVDCLRDFRPAAARTIVVRVSGVVRPTGMLIEPSASGGGLSRNDLRCIEQRMGSVILSPLDGSTSEPVATTIDLPYEPSEEGPVESYEVNPPPPPGKDVVLSLPKKKPIEPSGKPIEGGSAVPIEGPSGVPIEGGNAVPIEGPRAVPIGSDL